MEWSMTMCEFKECDLVAWIGVSCNKYMIEAVEDDGYFFGRNENGENELFFMPFADTRSQLIRVGRLDEKENEDNEV